MGIVDRLTKVEKASVTVRELHEQFERLKRDISTIDREVAKRRLEELNGVVELAGSAGISRTGLTAGWRPCVGWIAGIALGYHFIGRDILSTILLNTLENPVLPPAFDMTGLMTLLGSLLGLGGLRTVEKIKGVAK